MMNKEHPCQHSAQHKSECLAAFKPLKQLWKANIPRLRVFYEETHICADCICRHTYRRQLFQAEKMAQNPDWLETEAKSAGTVD